MQYVVDRVSEDAETKQRVLILRLLDGEDKLALNIAEREAIVLDSLLAEDGMPDTAVLEHLRDAASRHGGIVIGVQLLLTHSTGDVPALTPVLILRQNESDTEQAVPASLAHAAAWSIALNLPFAIDDGLVHALQSVITIIPGEVPSGFRELLAGLDDIDRV